MPSNVFKPLVSPAISTTVLPAQQLILAQLAQMASMWMMVPVLSMNVILTTVIIAQITPLAKPVPPIISFSTTHVSGRAMPAMLRTVLLVHMPQNIASSAWLATCLQLPILWAARTMPDQCVLPILNPWSPTA